MTTGALIYTGWPGGVIYTKYWRLGKNKAGESGRKWEKEKYFGWREQSKQRLWGRKDISILGQKAYI